MTRAQILERWVGAHEAGPFYLMDVPERGVEQGKLARAGSGNRGNAFRYTLPSSDFDWDVDLYELLKV